MPRRETWCWLPAMPRVIAPARVGADAYRCGGEVPAWAWPTSPGAGRHTPRRLPGRTRMIVSLGGRQGKGCDAAGRAATGLRLRLANGRGYTSDTCAAGPPVADPIERRAASRRLVLASEDGNMTKNAIIGGTGAQG